MSKRVGSMASVVCMKTLLMLLNIFLWVIGIGMFAGTIYYKFKMDSYMRDMTPSEIVLAFAATLILTTILACCCTVMGHPALLYLYGAFLAVLAVLELAYGATIYSFQCDIMEEFAERLNNSLLTYGRDSTETDGIDTIQSLLECCGNKGYEDWNSYPTKEVPVSCCKVPHGECDITDPEDLHSMGCYNFLVENVEKWMLVAARLLAVLAGVTIVTVVLACCLASRINRRKFDESMSGNNHRVQHLP